MSIFSEASAAKEDSRKGKLQGASLNDFAKAVGKSRKAVEGWIQQGMPHTRDGRGHVMIDDAKARQWMETALRKPGRPKSKASEDMDAAKLRRERARAGREELELAQLKGEYVRRDENEASNIRKFTHIRNAFQGLPTRMAPVLYGRDPADIEQMLDTEVRKILESLSRGDREDNRTTGQDGQGGDGHG